MLHYKNSKAHPNTVASLRHFKELLLQKQFIDLSGLKRLAQHVKSQRLHAPKLFSRPEGHTKTSETD